MASKTKKTNSFQFQISWPEESTFELVITIPWKTIKQAYQEALKEEQKKSKLPGFRKGKAPLQLIEKTKGKEFFFQKVIEKIIPSAYAQGVKKYQLSPIVPPQINLQSAKEGKDWVFKAVSCQLPSLKLSGWKEEVRKINAAAKIWTPQKGEKTQKKETEEEKQKRWQQIIEKLLSLAKVKFPPLLIESELEKKLASLIDQLQAAGLTLSQYLKAKQKTLPQLKEEYRQEIETNLKLDLILEKIADEAQIRVEKEEVEKLLKEIEKSPEKKEGSPNPYWLAHFLRQQKTLAYLLNL